MSKLLKTNPEKGKDMLLDCVNTIAFFDVRHSDFNVNKILVAFCLQIVDDFYLQS